MKGFSIFFMLVVFNKGREGIFLDILMFEECDFNLVGRIREIKGLFVGRRLF